MDAPSRPATPDELAQRPALEVTLPAASAPRSDATPLAAAGSGDPPPLALAPTLDGSSRSGSAPPPASSASAASPGASKSGASLPASVPVSDRYEFLCLLGRGGMGAVYKARDRQLDRIVALKFLHGDNPAQVQRFLQEARAQARLDHPHICKISVRRPPLDGKIGARGAVIPLVIPRQIPQLLAARYREIEPLAASAAAARRGGVVIS